MKPETLKVMFVSAETLAEGFAAHTHVTGLSNGLRQLGHQTMVIGRQSGSYFESSIPARFLRYVAINIDAVRMMSCHDVLIARAHFANLPWVSVARLRGIPVVQEMNGLLQDAATTHPWLRAVQIPITWSYRWQLASASAVACVTGEIARQVQKLTRNVPVEIITNGVDTDKFFPDIEASRSSDYAIFCSALTPWHGIDTLLQAIEHPAWPKGLRLLIAGDGAEADRVRDAAARNHRITYIGLQSRKGLAKLIRSACLGLSPLETLAQRGITEVSPLKLYEMMASGIAIIATDLAGQRELVLESGCGVVIAPSEPAALAQAVNDVFHDPQRSLMGQKGALVVASKHDWRHRAESLANVIKMVLGHKTEMASGTASGPE